MNVLQQIVRSKRTEVEQRKQAVGLESLRERALAMPRPRNFFHAVTTPTSKPLNLIAEIKKASPSAGVIRNDFDPARIAAQYAHAGADCISVLTDEKFFQGDLAYIEQARAAAPLPVLRKDFIIDPYQVYEARVAGADAVLLIAECLRTGMLLDLAILAAELHLTALIEVHDVENLMRVRDRVVGFPHRGYSLLGINNRDLTTFKTDLGTTLRLAELVEDRSVLVSESGIQTAADVRRLADAGVRAALIGETLMRAPDVEAKVKEMFGG
jgi:indole-3-glycerol phosphate synthase